MNFYIKSHSIFDDPFCIFEITSMTHTIDHRVSHAV